ncbi:Smr/MutS family protein [Terrimonas pollutisoli]|uniref:Smr/MutS family protein n=1 Tax=Terrimonas pollutisoli TaxID=3034147 RepID=UPI0023ECE011|nr:Smr/MutS family protein [Terrimonas sp. H1YJ31]
MKYQVGDIVLVLHSNEEGKIVDFINEEMAMVEIRGVRFPVYMDQIDFPYFKRFTEKKIVPPKKQKKYVDDVKREKPTQVEKVVDGVWLTFLPVMDTDEFGDLVVEQLKVHLVNRTETPYNFIYKLNFFGETDFDLKNKINSFEDFYLHDIPFEDMNDNPSFDFEFSLVQPEKKKADYYESSVKLKAKQLFAKIEEVKEKNLATFSYKLFDKYPDKLIEDRIELGKLAAKGFKVYNAKEARQHLESPRTVIDLHAEKLTDEWQNMSNYEILSLQLKTFEKYYELALSHMQPSLTVVHGMGTGRLRDEIHDLLRLRREVKSFVNQYHPQFGYGATEIFFQY